MEVVLIQAVSGEDGDTAKVSDHERRGYGCVHDYHDHLMAHPDLAPAAPKMALQVVQMVKTYRH